MFEYICVNRQSCGLFALLGEASCICVGARGFLFSPDMICDAEGHMHVDMCEPVDVNVCALT